MSDIICRNITYLLTKPLDTSDSFCFPSNPFLTTILAPIQNKVSGKPAFKNRKALGGALFTGRPLGGTIVGCGSSNVECGVIVYVLCVVGCVAVTECYAQK